ncbi:MAG TPA: tripartite tricarboxylate transporter substrate-binding protein, partial [Burkholderiales bacterium]|nr:tripartite tricarboxylate transporter substrate-binding protein [Burkholderiales bacterium]
DYVVTTVPSVIAQVKAGQLRVLGVASPQRLRGALANAPTLKEQGMDSVSSNWRMVVGPKGMSAPQAQYWDGVFGKMVQTAEWKTELDASLQEFVYLNSRDSLKYCEQENVDKTQTLAALGLTR